MSTRQTTIIYAHPWVGSFNQAVLQSVCAGLKKAQKKFKVIDLYADKFNPVLSEADLAGYSKGKTTDRKVLAYQKIIDASETLVFISPIWWTGFPAILKGFIDKVFLNGWAYETKGLAPKGKLKNIKQVVLINTMSAPSFIYRLLFRAPLWGGFIVGVLRFCGIKKVKWFKLDNILTTSEKRRKSRLHKIEKFFSKK